MSTFKDLNDKSWTVALDGPMIRAVRQTTCTLGNACASHGPKDGEPKQPCDGVDLAAIDGSAAQRMQLDPLLLHDTLWILCEAQARDAQIASPAFYAAVCGDATERGFAAIEQAISDFFPSRKRTLLTSLLSKQHQMSDKAYAMAQAKLENPALETAVMAKLEAQLDAQIEKLIQSNSVTSGPELSE